MTKYLKNGKVLDKKKPVIFFLFCKEKETTTDRHEIKPLKWRHNRPVSIVNTFDKSKPPDKKLMKKPPHQNTAFFYG